MESLKSCTECIHFGRVIVEGAPCYNCVNQHKDNKLNNWTPEQYESIDPYAAQLERILNKEGKLSNVLSEVAYSVIFIGLVFSFLVSDTLLQFVLSAVLALILVIARVVSVTKKNRIKNLYK